MRAPLSLALFAGGVAAAFAAAFLAGGAVDPVIAGAAATGDEAHDSAAMDSAAMDQGMATHPEATDAAAAGQILTGLAVSEAGYTLAPQATAVRPGDAVPFRFTVNGPDGRPVTDYAEAHEKELHLIVVRRDLDGFQHVHPTRAADGTWSVPLDLSVAGTYRVFADFQPRGLGRELTLGTDLHVAGAYAPTPLPAPASSATSGGYQVSLDGPAVAGRETLLTFTVTRAGAPVTDLQPYLGAFGHLVSLREGDLAYLHTHPEQDAQPGDRGGPVIRFGTEFPTAGTYRLFLDFRTGGQVRTVAFTVEVTP